MNNLLPTLAAASRISSRAMVSASVASLAYMASVAMAGEVRSCAWPATPLPPGAAVKVDPAQFVCTQQLKDWQRDLDQRGFRATGSPAHEVYIDTLYARLGEAGVKDLHYEYTTFPRWSTDSWSFNVASGSQSGTLKAASYIPWSGTTPAQGITLPLVYMTSDMTPTSSNVGGKIVLFDVSSSGIPYALFLLDAMKIYDPKGELLPKLLKSYSRTWLSQSDLIAKLTKLEAAGAAGVVAVMDASFEDTKGLATPYDAVIRKVPGVFVDKDTGAKLKAIADGNTLVNITLPAKVEQATTRNIVGVIPGMKDEYTVINSHSDGSNGIEDNGPNAIVAMAQYLTRLPKLALPRSIMVMISSGHFAAGVGSRAFIDAHRSDGLLDKIASITTIEHLGAMEYEKNDAGVYAPTGHPEPGLFFAPRIRPLVNAAGDALRNAQASPALVGRPLSPNATGLADDPVWPGEGQYFWGIAKIPTANYITGPNYLLTYGIDTVGKTDFDRVQREVAAFTQMQLDLSRVSFSALRYVDPLCCFPF